MTLNLPWAMMKQGWTATRAPRFEKLRKAGSMGIIEVELFSEDVESQSHPKAIEFRRLLEQVAEEYDCQLLSYEVDHGTVSFSFDDDVLTAEILKVLGAR